MVNILGLGQKKLEKNGHCDNESVKDLSKTF